MKVKRKLLTPRSRQILETVTGTLFCTWMTVTVAVLGQNLTHPVSLLALVVPCIGFVARIWGILAALLGLACSALVSCTSLLAPVGSIAVASAGGRAVVFWMILWGGFAAYVFARPRGSYGSQETRSETTGH